MTISKEHSERIRSAIERGDEKELRQIANEIKAVIDKVKNTQLRMV